jgi:ParB-like chromosome segregation protein Spo0J
MSTLAEIQDAVTHLSDDERKALQLWLNSQAEPEMTAQEEQQLLRSLDAAVRDIAAGKGVTIDEVRRRVGSRAVK